MLISLCECLSDSEITTYTFLWTVVKYSVLHQIMSDKIMTNYGANHFPDLQIRRAFSRTRIGETVGRPTYLLTYILPFFHILFLSYTKLIRYLCGCQHIFLGSSLSDSLYGNSLEKSAAVVSLK
jgi:hypothetical protein